MTRLAKMELVFDTDQDLMVGVVWLGCMTKERILLDNKVLVM